MLTRTASVLVSASAAAAVTTANAQRNLATSAAVLSIRLRKTGSANPQQPQNPQGQDASKSEDQTNARTKAQAQAQPTAAAIAAAASEIRASHPRVVFRQQMTKLRKQYQEEVKELAAKSSSNKEQLLKESYKAEALRAQDIAEFKRQREAYLRGIDAFMAPMNIPSPVDAVLHSKPQKSSSPKPGSSEKDPIDTIFEERKRMWRQYCLERRQRRFATFANQRQNEANSRLDALTYLFHASSDFVTYHNLDSKIDAVLRLTSGTWGKAVPELLAEAEQRDLGNENMVVFMQESATGKVSREAALKEALFGTTLGERMDAQTIREKYARSTASKMTEPEDTPIPESELDPTVKPSLSQ